MNEWMLFVTFRGTGIVLYPSEEKYIVSFKKKRNVTVTSRKMCRKISKHVVVSFIRKVVFCYK